jgi:lambda family phage portal protein
MALTLSQRLQRSQVKRQIAENEAQERRAKNYLNENLKNTRKRKLGWTEPGKPERDLTNRDRRTAMSMARQKVEESPIAAAIINARLDNIVGSGFRLMMRSGNIDWDNQVEEWWSLAKDRLDIRGVRPWQELLRCWQARHDIDGDVGILMVADMFDDVPQSWVQTIESDRIAKDALDLADTGIEFDQYGMPKSFYVLPYDPNVKNPNDSQVNIKPIKYKAENFILYMNDLTYRANRARGVTAFLQAFNILKDHEEILDAIVQKVKNEAFIGLKFFMEGNEDGNVFGSQAQRDATMENGVDYSKVKLVPGMNLVLGEGENVDVLESKSPHSEFDAFEKKLISRISMPFGFSYELITGDFSAMNDRTARVQLKQFEKRIRREQNQLGVVASRIFQWALSRAVKYGQLNPPAGVSGWWSHRWGRPGFPYINILQEAQANILLLENGLTSRTKILAEQGDDDFEDLMDERQFESEVLSEREISPQSITLQEDASQDEQ